MSFGEALASESGVCEVKVEFDGSTTRRAARTRRLGSEAKDGRAGETTLTERGAEPLN
jgi:hypothetical protein